MPKLDQYTKKVLDNDDKYIIFYSSWCGYSQRALEFLRSNNLPYKGYSIDKIKNGLEHLLKRLGTNYELTNFQQDHRTRPIVFHNGKFVGGYTELVDYAKNRKSADENNDKDENSD